YRHLRALANEGARFCVIGGGFIGSEIAAALALNDCPVTMVFPESGICARVFPEELSTALNDYYRSHGVEVLTGVSVTASARHRQVGPTMAVADAPHDHLPSSYSDLFDLGYEAIGEVDSRLETASDWKELAGEATVTYLDSQRRPRGVLLWNRFGQLDAALDL